MNAHVRKLFDELADLTEEQRAHFFAEHTVDEHTRREVEALLVFDSDSSNALAVDIGLVAGRALGQFEARGRRCGPYRLLEVIGRGGMGAVYLAERADGEITQRVAIKLLGPGSRDPQRRERFLQERQILASLTHPNIGRMLDAGHSEDGEPYLAMEYIDGKPIDLFAAELSVRQKVTLMLKVCAAVSYLHQNLIVHRDLKPSNILVSSDGEPKLLDFGIAKILDLTTDSTMTGMRMLTPDYASPEQVSSHRVSTGTDIYSLGAVLYKILTGKPVHEFKDHSPEAIALSIATREVIRPSLIARDLKGDLEAILLKSLRKDPRERYATIEQFADDLRAFLESRAVRARSGNAWYRARKFFRRYWIQVTAATVVILSMSAGLYVADRQRRVAERRFAQLRQLAHQVLFDLDPDLSGIPTAIEARKKVLATSTQYLAGLSADPIHDKQLSLEVAQSYMQVARIQGVPAWNNLGQYAEAMESLRKAEAFVEPVLVEDPDNREALWLSANVAHDKSSVANFVGWPEQVIASAPKVAERFNQLVRLGNLTRKEINGATYMYSDIAEHYIDLHRFEDAVRVARAGIEISSGISTVPGPRASAFSALAGALKCLGDFPAALQAIQQARSEWEKYRSGGGYHRSYGANVLAELRWRQGSILADDDGPDLNQPAEAAAVFRQGFDAVEEIASSEPKDFHTRHHVAELGLQLGNVLRHSNAKLALNLYDHALMRIREVPRGVAARREEALLLAGSSYAARSIHHESDARERIDTAVRLLRETKDYPADAIKPGGEADIVLRSLADHYAATGEPAKAVESYKELLHKKLSSNPDQQSDLVAAASLSRDYASLTALLKRVGRLDEAGTLEARRAELWRNWNRKLPNNPFVLRQMAGLSRATGH